VSGVLVLAESHVSIHTWPERDYAALDIFVCGDCDPLQGDPALKRGFLPERVQLAEHKRGLIG
jgi:S-adenosylmethionine decarboxylase